MNPGERSMYHESWRTEYVSWRKSLDIINTFLFFSKKNLENGVRIMKRKSSKTQGKLFRAPFPRISRLHVFLEKMAKAKQKPILCGARIPPGARIHLEHESPWRANPPRARISFALEWAIFFFYHHFFEPAHLPWVWMDVKTIESPQLICIIPIDCRQHLFWTKW